MKKEIAALSMHELRVTSVYTGSIGDFRYRFHMEFDSNELDAATYTKWCYEKATDVEEAHFTIEHGDLTELKQWLNERYYTYFPDAPVE
mgnify:FL=1